MISDIFRFISLRQVKSSQLSSTSSMSPACCPEGSWPQLLRPATEVNKDDVPPPQGSLIDIPTEGGETLPVYFVQPSGKSLGSIMVLPDIYSVRVLTNHARSGDRIGSICDMLAQAGYTVALPSIFRDKPYDLAITGPEDGNFLKFDCFAPEGGGAWFGSQNYAKVGPDVKATAKFLSEKTNGQALGVLGFCYSTWLLSKASSSGDVSFACAVGCHPATALEKLVFGGDEIAMLNGLKQPTRFLWAGNDSDIYINSGPGQAALEASGGGVSEYKDMLHGWVSRGDVADEEVKKGVEKALNEITGFFDEKMPKA